MPVFKKCQIFTPPAYVKKLLDVVGYKKNLYGKKVAENSCGDGNILFEIVERYIKDCFEQNFSIKKITKGLNTDIWAAEIDVNHIEKCTERLDNLAASYGIKKVKWNIFHGDSLKIDKEGLFDYVIGNPPYITYKELSLEERTFLRTTFDTCAFGKFDYCYAFIEAGLLSLNKNGKFAYLIPGNIFKNRFAENLRNHILPFLTDIYDYTNQKLFTGKLTSSSIIVCDKSKTNHKITYHNMTNKDTIDLLKPELGEKWVFSQYSNDNRSEQIIRFGDYFHTASSIATLLNKVFIISEYEIKEDYITAGEHKIEIELLKNAVSPRSLNYRKEELLIFPYYYVNNELRKYTEIEFETRFPYATAYLKSYIVELENRNIDKGCKWFEYGRSQALSHLNQRKLLISPLITHVAKVYELNKETMPTSGLYIIKANNQKNYTLKQAKSILESSLFFDYVKSIGVISNGNSYRLSPKDINNFTFPAEMLT